MFGLFCRGSVGVASYLYFSGWSQSQKLQGYLWLFSALNIVLIALERVGVICSPLVMWGLVLLAIAAGTCSHYYWDDDCAVSTPFFAT